MADLLRRVAVLAINRASYGNIRALVPLQVRTIFSSSGIGIDNFKLSREQHASRYAPSIDGFKKRFTDALGQADAPILTEDLRNMIMTAESDQDINTVIDALKKYSTTKQKFTDYHFGSPVMRLLYTQNKTDLAMQLFMDESLKNVFNDSASALVLMNKLIEDKRYDEAVKVFEFGSQRGFSTSTGRAFPTDVIMLAIEALYRQNTKESLAKAKEIVSKVTERDADINPRTAAMAALLAIQQGEPSFAMEITGTIRSQNLTTVQNIRAICYAELDRIEEAINVVHLLADQVPMSSDRRRVFPLVMRHIRMAVEKSKDQALITRFEELSKSVLKNNRLSTTDLPEFLSQAIDRRGPRTGVQQFSGGNMQRTGGNFRNTGYRQGFNQQQSNNGRQGMSGGFDRGMGGYNRDNRYGAGNYNQQGRNSNNNFQRQDSGYNRRSQNAYVDGNQRNNNERFDNRNRSASYNDYSREDSFSRTNRNDDGGSPSRARTQESEQTNANASMKRAGNRSDSTWANADDSDGSRTNRRDNNQQGKRTRSANLADDSVSPLTRRLKEEKSGRGSSSGGSDSWNQADRPSS